MERLCKIYKCPKCDRIYGEEIVCPYCKDTICRNAESAERIKELEEVIAAALRISDLWTLKEVETMFEDEAKALAIMKTSFEQALKG